MQPHSVREALHCIFSKKEMKQFCYTNEEELLSVVSETLKLNPTRLLYNVGYALGLECKTELESPNEELISLCGYSEDTLLNKLILPQTYKDSFSLVVASPLAVNIDDWLESRVPIYLSTATAIRGVWIKYYDKECSGSLRWDMALKDLNKLINKAKKEGELQKL